MANINAALPSIKLNSGASMPMLGYGTGTSWYKSGDELPVDKALIESTQSAIKMKYHLDCAEMYKTETEVGQAIKASGVERSSLWVTTKVNNNMDDIAGQLATSLKKLQLDYVDLYLLHTPFKLGGAAGIQAAWAQMEALQHTGRARSIGVSNFAPVHMAQLMETAKIPPAVNQVEFHAYLQSPNLVAANKKVGCVTAAYGPLSPVTKGAPGPVDAVLERLAHKYAVHPAEVLLRWCIDQDVVPVTTTSKEQRMSDYMRVAAFQLSPREILDISEAGKGKTLRGFFKEQFEGIEV